MINAVSPKLDTVLITKINTNCAMEEAWRLPVMVALLFMKCLVLCSSNFVKGITAHDFPRLFGACVRSSVALGYYLHYLCLLVGE